MKRTLSLLAVSILAASSMAGILLYAVPSPAASTETLLQAPLRFQLNGKDPYTIKVPMRQGETVSGIINSTDGSVTFSIVFNGVTIQSESVSASSQYQFTATTSGNYELDFTSTRTTLVSVDIYSSR